MTKKRILVLGGGFAGVDCTKKLENYFQSNYDIEITLVSDDNFLLFKGESGCRDAGKLKQEGKNYIVQDGDIFNFLFNI